MTTIVASEILGSRAPFQEDFGIEEDQFINIMDLRGKSVGIMGAKGYENDKGEGVFLALTVDGQIGYTATHAVGIVRAFTDPKVIEVLERGDTIVGTVTEKVSKKTGNRFLIIA